MDYDPKTNIMHRILSGMVELKECAQCGAEEETLEAIMAYIEQNVDALAKASSSED